MSDVIEGKGSESDPLQNGLDRLGRSGASIVGLVCAVAVWASLFGVIQRYMLIDRRIDWRYGYHDYLALFATGALTVGVTSVIVFAGGPDAVEAARRRMTAVRGGIAAGLIFVGLALANLAIAIAPLAFRHLRWDYVWEWCALTVVTGVLTAVAVRGWLAYMERRATPRV